MFKRSALAASALLCAQAAFLHAADLKDFPAGTRWVVNVDVKAACAAPMLRFMADTIAPAKRQDAQAKLAAIKALFGVDLLNDISQVVIAGDGGEERGGVAYLYATLDAARLTTILASNPTFTSTEKSGFNVLSWVDDKDKKKKFGAFVRPGLAVLSDRQERLNDTLEVLAGRSASLAPDSPLAPALAHSGQELLTVHASDLASLVGAKPKAESLKQAKTLHLTVSAPQPDALNAALAVTATSDETGLQIRQALMGIQALAQLRAAEDPGPAALAALARVGGTGSTVTLSLALPKSAVESFMKQQREKQQAAAAAAAAPAAPAATN